MVGWSVGGRSGAGGDGRLGADGRAGAGMVGSGVVARSVGGRVGWVRWSAKGADAEAQRLPAPLIALAPMPTAAGESTPQRIATIREQLKLLGDYL